MRTCAEILSSRLLIVLVVVLSVSRISNAQICFKAFNDFFPDSVGSVADIWQIGVDKFVIRSSASRPFGAPPFYVSEDGKSWKSIEAESLYGTFQQNPRMRASAVSADSLVVVLLADDSTSNRVVRISSDGSTAELPSIPNFDRNSNTLVGDLVDINGTLVAIIHKLNDEMSKLDVAGSDLFWLDEENSWRLLDTSLAKSGRAGVFLQNSKTYAYAISEKDSSTILELIEAKDFHNLSTSVTAEIELVGMNSLRGLGLASNNLCFLATEIDLKRSYVLFIDPHTANVQRFPLQPDSRVHYATEGADKKLLLVVSNTSLHLARISSEIEFQLIELEIEANGVSATRTNIPIPDLPSMRSYIYSAKTITHGLCNPLVLYHRAIAWDR